MHLGQRAYEQGDYLRAEEWFRVAYQRLWESETGGSAEERGDSGRVREKRDASQQGSEEFIIPYEVIPTDMQILDHLAYSLGRVRTVTTTGFRRFFRFGHQCVVIYFATLCTSLNT